LQQPHATARTLKASPRGRAPCTVHNTSTSNKTYLIDFGVNLICRLSTSWARAVIGNDARFFWLLLLKIIHSHIGSGILTLRGDSHAELLVNGHGFNNAFN
jgi:hypothetical protein